ncbi:MAG: sugar phosphate nucleotidyltransferase [Rikenellaceae bacterium]
MKPTLLILAAGMGSRYGSLKQMDGIGPCKEAIIDFTIFDAMRAGFGKVVFVIRGTIEEQFKNFFNAERFNNQIEVEYVMQELDKLPEGYSIPEGREKPWGTAHAVMMAKEVVNEPFAVVNADDFYGENALKVIGEYLAKLDGKKGQYTMVGYEVNKTLSENGTVSRGVCQIGRCSQLSSMVERTKIERQNGQIVYIEDEGTTPLAEDALVSMNLFGFTPDIFEHSEELFKAFLDTQAKVNPKAEFFIPLVVNSLLENKTAKMKVLKTTSDWFGVTYIEDRPATVERVAKLTADGVYPTPLWK